MHQQQFHRATGNMKSQFFKNQGETRMFNFPYYENRSGEYLYRYEYRSGEIQNRPFLPIYATEIVSKTAFFVSSPLRKSYIFLDLPYLWFKKSKAKPLNTSKYTARRKKAKRLKNRKPWRLLSYMCSTRVHFLVRIQGGQIPDTSGYHDQAFLKNPGITPRKPAWLFKGQAPGGR